jgi:tetratricopeptide (TPR) repeat protein
MPIDAPNPRGREPQLAISVSYIRERLSRSGADNVILLLDACRDEGSRDNSHPEWEPQQGIITISACSPLQKSWEIESLQQGAFTYALLALRIPGERNCATVERLDNYLRYRVPQLCRDNRKVPEQLPRIAADPAEKLHFILLPKYATLSDIDALKNDAYQAEVYRKFELAEQLWVRILAATFGKDMEAVKAIQRLANSETVNSLERGLSQKQQVSQSKLQRLQQLTLEMARQTIPFARYFIEALEIISSDSGRSSDVPQNQSKQANAWILASSPFGVGLVFLGIVGGGWVYRDAIGQWLHQTSSSGVVSNSQSLNILDNKALEQLAVDHLKQGKMIEAKTAITVLLDRRALQEATSVLQQIPGSQANTPAINFLKGRMTWQQWLAGNKDYSLTDVRRFWETAAKEEPFTLYQNALGFAYYAEGQWERAEQAWLQALQTSGGASSPQTPVVGSIDNSTTLTSYAGLALTSMRSAGKHSTLRAEALKLRQQVLNEDKANFQPEALSKNWMWSEKAIQDWRSLLQQGNNT